jgi:NAD(P)H-hydrate epimerase
MLMDRAGYAVALAASDVGAGYGSVVDVLCGKGNNGGDGYVAARYLTRRGATVTAHQIGQPAVGTPAYRAMESAHRAGVTIVPLKTPGTPDVLIDAVVGTGFTGELSPDVAVWTEVDAAVVAVDIPSGLGGDTGVPNGAVFGADVTVTLHSLKPGHMIGVGPDLCGEIRIVDIGLTGGDPTMSVMDRSDVVVPTRLRTAHKWSSGAVATIGGVSGLSGAALYSARAALRAGAGVSVLVATSEMAPTYEARAADLVVMDGGDMASEGDALALVERLSRFDTLIVGPGLEPAPLPFVHGLAEAFDGMLVLDAGALGAIADPQMLANRTSPTVLTPHAGEFEKLSGEKPTWESAVRLSELSGSVVLLKGNPTIVSGPEVIIVDTGGPELATIGSGDVLAGVIGAFGSTTIDTMSAVTSAAYIHGLAGQRAAESSSVTVLDVLEAVGPVVAGF